MVRTFEGPYASSIATDLPGLLGRRRASLSLRVWRGCRSLTCLHGTHVSTGVQAPPTSSVVVNYVERSNPAPSPGPTGQALPQGALLELRGRDVGRSECPGESPGIEHETWLIAKAGPPNLGEKRADVRRVSHCERVCGTFERGKAIENLRVCAPASEAAKRRVRRPRMRIAKVVQSITVPPTKGCILRGLSRVTGNFHARFLGGNGAARPLPYPVQQSENDAPDHRSMGYRCSIGFDYERH